MKHRSRSALLFAAAASVAALASTAGTASAATTDTWLGAVDANWSTNGNWTTTNGGGIPLAGDSLVYSGTTGLTSNNDLTAGTSFAAITFNSGAGAFNLTGNGIALTGALTDNVAGATETIGIGVAGTSTSSLVMNGGTTGTVAVAVNASSSFGSFSLSDTPLATAGTIPASILTVASGQTLTINGTFQAALNAASAVNVADSLTSGTPAGAGGELDVNGSFTVGASNGKGAGKNTTTVDLSGLSTVKINSAAGTLNIGNGTNIRGNLTLASGTSSVNEVTVATINLGTSGSGNAQTGSQLNMGQGSNKIFANAINIGGGKSNGVFQFVGSSASATATIGGTSSVVGNLTNTNITIGSETSGTATTQTSSLLLAGHNVTVQAGTVIVAQSNGNSAGTALGTLTFDNGTFNIATGLQLAVGTGGTSGTAGSTGTVTGGGTFNVNGLFNLGNDTNTGATAGTSTAKFTINNGSVSINTNVVVASTKGATVSTFELLGGTLDMKGFAIGGSGAVNSGNAAIGTVNLPGASQTATLANLGGTGINGTAGTGASSGGLTMGGAGTLIVGGANTTYSGATTINAGGTLQVGTATLAEQLPAASIVTNNGTLNFGGANTATIANVIGGSGVVNQIGSGSTILSNTSNYTGNTGVSAGTLIVNGSLASGGNVNLGGTGTLAGGGSAGNLTMTAGTLVGGSLPVSTSGTLTLSSLNMSGGNLLFDIGTSTSNSINVLGTANFTGGGFSLLLGRTTTGQTFTVLSSTGLTNSGLNLTPTVIGRTTLTPSVSGNNLIVTVGGGAASLIWNNTAPATGDGLTWDNGTNQNWQNAGSPDVFIVGDNVLFNDSNNGHYAVTLNSSVAPGSVTVDNSAGDYTISGTGAITGATGLTKKGSSTLTLGTVNTYTGTTAVQGGMLKVGVAGAIPAGGAVVLGDGGTGSGVLDLNGIGTTVGGLTTSGTGTGNAVTNGGGADATLTFAGGSSTFGGAMTDGGTNKLALTVSGGTLALSGASTYTGNTTINPTATLQIGAGGTSGSLGSTAIVDNGTLAFNRSDSITDSHAISGTGAVSQLAANTLSLGGALTYTGPTNIAAGGAVRVLGATQSLAGAVNGAGNLVVGDGTNATSLTLANAGNGYTGSTTVSSGSTLTIPTAGSISATSGVTIDGGTEVINSATSGKNFGTGKTITITSNGGTIRYGTTAANNGLQNPVQLNGPLTIDLNDNSASTKTTFLDSANLSGTGSLLVQNSGTWNQDTLQFGVGGTTPSNSSGYSGPITVGGPNNVGVRLQPVSGAVSALGTGTVTVNNGSQVFFGGNQTFTNTFNIAGIGTPVDSPTFGALRLANGQTLSGNINLTGDANISIGTNASNTGTLSGPITGAGKALSLQSGVFTFTNSSGTTNYGSTVLTRHDTVGNSGPATLVVGNVNAVSSGGMTIDGGALELNGNSMSFANLASIGPNGVIISPSTVNGASGNNWVMVASSNSISTGNRMSGTGVPIGTFVTGIATTEAPTVPGGAAIGATTIPVNSLVGLVPNIGQTVTSGTAIPAGTTIVGISGTNITLSNALTGAIANNGALSITTVNPVLTINQSLSGNVAATVNVLHNGAVSNDGPATTANATLTFGSDNSDQLFGGLILDGNSGGTLAITKVGAGNETFSNVNTYTGNTNVNAGTLTIGATGGLNGSTNVNVASGATLNVNGSLAATTVVNANGTTNFAGSTGATVLNRPLAALNIGTGVTASVTASAFPATPSVLQPGTLTFADGTAKLNLTNNELINNEDLATTVGRVTSNQIFTTSTGGALGTLALSPTQTEVRFTLLGDTNLDGSVDVTDLGNLASSYGANSGAIWVQGDTNYDGAVDVTDLGNLASNYGGSLASGPSAGSASAMVASSMATVASGGSSSVPEPTSLGLIGLGAAGLLGRRRRKA